MKAGFFIVGAPKCGTSALASYLSENPEISFSDPKEPHFFSTDMPEKTKISTFQHYEKIFPLGKSVKIRGEGSIWYLYSSVAPFNIYKYNPDAKIIIMIRDPIHFIESLHNQNVIGGHDKCKKISDSVRVSLAGRSKKFNVNYVELSRYAKYITVYEDVFGKNNVMTVLQEELKSKPRETYLKLLNFLGVEDDGRSSFEPVNERRVHKYKILEFLLTRDWTNMTKMVEPLRRLFKVGSFGIYKKVMDFNSKRASTEKLPDDLIIEVKQYLEEDMAALFDKIPRSKIKKYWGNYL